MHESLSSQRCSFTPIGRIESPFLVPEGTPIQSSRASGACGVVHIDAPFRVGMRDLEGFERIWLIYWLHQVPGTRLLVTPFLDTKEKGIFATRSPVRPNAIGMSPVRLISVQEEYLEVADLDVIDGTPVLDIKPYVPEFDSYPESRAGWFDQSKDQRSVADARFDRKL